MDGRIFHIKERLLCDLQRHWTIKEMAQEVGLSVPHFQKLFKTNVGSPPMTYLQELRLEKAGEFLRETFLQIQEIRLEVGISQDSYFTRGFKKKYGISPTQFRKNYWEKIQSEKSDDTIH
jgi:AraC-like DNA-binding protein